jgi:signal transduction histidine kinase
MHKILVIDDEELFRQTTACALQHQGFETHEASDGVAGAELARRILPDLIVCDINMERMDGYTLLDTLRREPPTATIPFILMTGMGDSSSMRRGMNLGADDFLAKPFTAPQLFSAVNARLKKHQTLTENAEKKLSDLRSNLTLALPHEMITPLNGIFGPAEILATQADSLTTEDVAEFGASILTSAERLHRTVQNFLFYGQLEMQSTEPESLVALRSEETSQLDELVTDRARHHAGLAGRADDLRLELSDGSVAVARDLFVKLVDELIDNALKFSSAGSPIQITGTSGETGNYVLSIADEGVGMDAAQVAAVGAYSQFNRQAREQQGSGLGLAIVRRITELHQGQFEIQSHPGRGTCVTVRFTPMSSTQAQPEKSASGGSG